MGACGKAMEESSRRLGGKVAVVTGAAAGIGAASAAAMAANGASVVVGDIDLAGAEKQAAAIRAAGGEAISVHVNAAEGDSIQALLAAAVEEYGGLDVLHNNAIGVRRPSGPARAISHFVHESDEGWFDALLHATVTTTMHGIKHAVPLMLERGGGSIINTASISGIRGEVFTPAYGAGKAGVIQLTRSAAAMYGRQGIRCNAICPGLILTAAGDHSFDAKMKQAWQRHTPMNRLGRPEDVAHLAVYLACDESEYVTGQALVIDGGFTMHDPTWADRLDAYGI
jgi:NAD(P)-dependent dehydrogenase (short-subunit alcohol dehydrogenase family)